MLSVWIVTLRQVSLADWSLVAGCSTARGRPEGGAPGRMKSGGVQSTDSGLQGDVRAGLGGEVSRSKCPVSGFGGVQV